MNAPLARTKDVEIDGKRYQIVRMNPLVGSWVASELFTRMLPSGIEAQFMAEVNKSGALDQSGIMKLPASRSQMGMEDFIKLQIQCLLVCRWYDAVTGKDIATPVMTAEGQFVMPGLQDDVVSVLALSLHSLFFNVQPFFDKSRIAAVIASFQGDSKGLASVISMPSASGQ